MDSYKQSLPKMFFCSFNLHILEITFSVSLTYCIIALDGIDFKQKKIEKPPLQLSLPTVCFSLCGYAHMTDVTSTYNTVFINSVLFSGAVLKNNKSESLLEKLDV